MGCTPSKEAGSSSTAAVDPKTAPSEAPASAATTPLRQVEEIQVQTAGSASVKGSGHGAASSHAPVEIAPPQLPPASSDGTGGAGAMPVPPHGEPAHVPAAAAPASASTASSSAAASAVGDPTPTPLPLDPIAEEVGKAAREGVLAVLEIMKAHQDDSEYQWWCCDALAGLCAGNEEARGQLYVQNGALEILLAMRLYPFDTNVQCKACWALSNMAANYADYLGRQGAVDAIVAGMNSCQDDYQVQLLGTRCLQNLTLASDTNRIRAKVCGAEPLLQEALDRNPEDGQLQYRGRALVDKLREVTPEQIAAAGTLEINRSSPWNKANKVSAAPAALAAAAAAAAPPAEMTASALARAPTSGNLRRLPSVIHIPGLSGTSALVADRARREGVVGIVKLMKERPGSIDVAHWCCDALSTMMNGNVDARNDAYDAGGLAIVLDRMKRAQWQEEFQMKAMWALLAFAPGFSTEIGELGGIEIIVQSMYRNQTNHDIQVAAIKLLSLLTLEHTGKNIARARQADAVRIVKSVIGAHVEDGQLQFRGINLLERLEPNCTASMPKVNLIRSASMQAEEMVQNVRSVARINSSRYNITPGSGNPNASTVRRAPDAALNAQAIAEVDEMAEQVDESEDEDEGANRNHHAGAHHGHHHHQNGVAASAGAGAGVGAGNGSSRAVGGGAAAAAGEHHHSETSTVTAIGGHDDEHRPTKPASSNANVASSNNGEDPRAPTVTSSSNIRVTPVVEDAGSAEGDHSEHHSSHHGGASSSGGPVAGDMELPGSVGGPVSPGNHHHHHHNHGAERTDEAAAHSADHATAAVPSGDAKHDE